MTDEQLELGRKIFKALSKGTTSFLIMIVCAPSIYWWHPVLGVLLILFMLTLFNFAMDTT